MLVFLSFLVMEIVVIDKKTLHFALILCRFVIFLSNYCTFVSVKFDRTAYKVIKIC